MRIVWNKYIEEQLHWAERLEDIASAADADREKSFASYAKRASMNARAAVNLQIDSAFPS